MEQGKYEEGYNGVQNFNYAYSFYTKAVQQKDGQEGCREAQFKLGEYH